MRDLKRSQKEQGTRDKIIAEYTVLRERSIHQRLGRDQGQQEAKELRLRQNVTEEVILTQADMTQSSHDISPPLPPVSVNDTRLEATKTTYTRMARRHLSIEALRIWSIDFELDAVCFNVIPPSYPFHLHRP